MQGFTTVKTVNAGRREKRRREGFSFGRTFAARIRKSDSHRDNETEFKNRSDVDWC
jgi:hypothetical protein